MTLIITDHDVFRHFCGSRTARHDILEEGLRSTKLCIEPDHPSVGRRMFYDRQLTGFRMSS